MSTDNFDAAAALVGYYPNRTGPYKSPPARHWMTEATLHTLAALGIVEFFEGAGSDPTGLTGYASTKLWLQVEAGVTDAAGTVRVYDGSGSTSDVANWPVLTPALYRGLVGGIANVVEDVTPQLGGDLDLNGHVITGLEIGTDVQAHSTHLGAIDALDKTDGNVIVANGTTFVAESGATARASLGLAIGTDVQAYSAVLAGTTASSTTADETKLDYITITQAVDLDAIETRVNALDAAVVLSGTWDASAGTFPGSGSAQAGQSYIVSIGGTVDGAVFVANDRIVAIVDNASTSTYAANWHKLDYTDQVLSVNGATGAVDLSSTYQPLAARLTDIAALAVTDGNVIVGNGSTWVAESGATARTSLGAAGTSQANLFFSGLIETPGDQDYRIAVNLPAAITITSVTTIAAAGTASLTVKINTTALGGSANSVTTSEQTQAHGTSNAASAGDDIVLTVSSTSACEDLSFLIKYTMVLS